jgi:uncharacterized protein
MFPIAMHPRLTTSTLIARVRLGEFRDDVTGTPRQSAVREARIVQPERTMIKLLLIVASAAVAMAIGVRRLEPGFAFFPERGEQTTPAAVGIRFEPATIHTADGEQLRGWLMHAPTSPRARVLYFHGNGGNLSVWLPIVAGIVRQGYTVAAFDYRGYGLSSGHPSESGLYHDVDAALEWAHAATGTDRAVVYWGRSLGTTMAAYAAAKRPPLALILESGFPDARSLVRSSPVLRILSTFSSYRFPTTEYLDKVAAPVLVMHGDSDHVVPFAAGQSLYESITGPKEWFTIAGADHNDAVPPDAAAYWERVDRFVGRHAEPPADADNR